MKKSKTLNWTKGLCQTAIATSFMALSSGAAMAQNITFADIYAAPDDAPLNLAYANQEILNGDLLAAASALERLLLSQPNLDSTRLLYAKVLYMLDDHKAAVRELELLNPRALDGENRKTLKWLREKTKGVKA